MVMPRKPDPEKRSRQLNIYLQPKVYEAFQTAAEKRNASMSSLAAQLIEDFVSGTKIEEQQIVVPREIVMAVVQEIVQQGFEISDKFAPRTDNSAPQSTETVRRSNAGDRNVTSKTKRRAVDRGIGGESSDS